jgi:hypothetical protein
MFDWLPYNRGQSDQVPRDPRQRRAWLRESLLQLLAPLADKYRDLLIAEYGAERGRRIRYIEAFETCEYGTPLTPQGRRRLFPFLPVELWEAERIDRL